MSEAGGMARDRSAGFPYDADVQWVIETPAFLRDAKVTGMERDERDASVSF
jgi:hypothetical protein